MNKSSIKPFLIECGIISEVSADWKKDFISGTKGMPKANEDVINYAENIYFTSFEGEQNISIITRKWQNGLLNKLLI